MGYYTLFPDDDKQQVTGGGGAIDATSTRVKGGAAMFPGNISSNSVLTASADLGRSPSSKDIYGSQVNQSEFVWGAFEAAGVAISGVADNGSGDCRFTIATHGLTVGTVIAVRDSTTGNVDGIHVIDAVPTADTFDTRVAYVASASAGNYHLVTGRFASMTAGEWLMRGGVAMNIANTNLSISGFGHQGARRSIHYISAIRTVRVATAIRAGYWHIYSGVWTTAPTEAQDSWGDDHAALPTYAVPGELTYRTSGQPDGAGGGITSDDYEAKTG